MPADALPPRDDRMLRIAGVDEAGRGPLAGPVVVAAVVFPPGRSPVNGLADSKQLAPERREALYPRIIERALAWQVVFLVIASDVRRYRVFMLPAILEKLAFFVPTAVLYVNGRVAPEVLAVASVDLVLGALFALAYRAAGRPLPADTPPLPL